MMGNRDLALGYRRIVVLLLLLVVLPTFLLVAAGVVLLFLGDPRANLVIGILVVALGGAAITGVTLVWVFVRREANLSALQSDFVSKVSHELRTPLTSIRLFTETLSMRRGDVATEARCIEGLERESTRLQELIDRLLDWGRMESGRREFEFRRMDLRSIVDQALEAFRTQLEHSTVAIVVDVPDEPVYASVDRGAMVDAVLNLLGNAAKYAGDEVKVTVSVTRRGRVTRIAVRDDGPGIPQVEHKRIFQKFYRVDDRLSRVREGSGLGLAIVKHVVKAHGGRVELESAPGKGSTFALAIPGTEHSD
jgi:two-component system phosphate regulon sensor histidine kinase PhoR